MSEVCQKDVFSMLTKSKESSEPDTQANKFKEDLYKLCEKFSAAVDAQAWEEALDAMRELRELLGSAHNYDGTVSKVLIEREIIIQTLCLLKNQNAKLIKLQEEAAWLIANFSAGDSSDTAYLVQQGCIPILAECIQINNNDLQQNVMWALANLLGESDFSYRIEILKLDVIKKVIRLLCGAPKSMSYTRTVTWLLSNALRGPPYPPFDETSIMLTVFAQSIHSRDSQTIQYTLQGLYAMLLTGDHAALHSINAYKLFPKIYRLFSLQDDNISILALKIINELPEKYFANLMEKFDSAFGQALLKTLNSKNKNVALLGCDILDRLLEVEIEDQHLEIAHEMMPLVMEKVDDENEHLRQAAAFCIRKFVETRSAAELQFIISQGVISVVCLILKKEKNKEMVLACLEALSAILCYGERMTLLNGRNSSEILVSQSGGVEILKDLKCFDDQTIRDLIDKLLVRYFEGAKGNEIL